MRSLSVTWRVVVCLVLSSGGVVSAGEGVVALQTAEASCVPEFVISRYVPCDNGTVTDVESGLVWLANAECFGALEWNQAMAAVAGLSDLPDDGDACDSLTPDECDCGLSDGSSPGEWRLPSIEEWEAMVEDAVDVLSCIGPTITNDWGSACWNQECVHTGACSFYGVQSSWYWSPSSFSPDPLRAWQVSLDDGRVALSEKFYNGYVWPVRGGQ